MLNTSCGPHHLSDLGVILVLDRTSQPRIPSVSSCPSCYLLLSSCLVLFPTRSCIFVLLLITWSRLRSIFAAYGAIGGSPLPSSFRRRGFRCPRTLCLQEGHGNEPINVPIFFEFTQQCLPSSYGKITELTDHRLSFDVKFRRPLGSP